MIHQQERTDILAIRALNVILFRMPALALVNSLILPSRNILNAVLWGLILPWSILGLLTKMDN